MTAPQLPLLDIAARTDVGLVRPRNEDAVLAATPCFLVADGMGGYEAGDRASAAVIDAFREGIPAGGPATLGQVRAAFEAAEAGVAAVAAGTTRGAGSTLTGVVLVSHEGEAHWLLLNVGDSRVYQHFGSELRQLTVDHSLREEVRLGRGDAAGSAEDLPNRNVITRAIGAPESPPDTWLLPVVSGVRLLICSDGLHGEVPDERLRALLTMGGRAASVADELIRCAREAGGQDNISAIVVDVRSGGRPWQGSGAAGGGTAGESGAGRTETVTAPVARRLAR